MRNCNCFEMYLLVSGQFFFYSHDGKYMIKTQTKEEAILLRNIMPEYVEHLYNNPDSLLVRFYGMHRVKMKSLDRKIHFVIMSSVFDTDLLVHTKYDLKGSTIGRLTDAASCAAGAVQKDLNFMNSNRKIRLGPTNIKKFYDTLRADTRFLEKMNIMDYSLLIGIHDRKNADSSLNGNASNGNQAAKQTQVPNKANSSSKLPGRRRSSGVVLSSSVINNLENTRVTPTSHGVAKAFSFPHSPDTASEAHKSFYTGNNPAENNVCENESVPSSIFCSCDGGIASYAEDTDNNEGDETYFMGIIDILQLYNTGKKMETFFKGLSQDKTQLSSVNPSMYANRMVDFIMKSTDYEDTRHIHGGAAQAARRKK